MNWIKESVARSTKIGNHYKMHEVDIFIKDSLPDNVDPNFVFSYITKKLIFT